VRIAGEPERAARRAREKDGIWVDQQTWTEIEQSAAKVGAKI
jgi:uncharacterized oxidoreductase